MELFLFSGIQVPDIFRSSADEPERNRQYNEEYGFGGAIPEILKTARIDIQKQKGNTKTA